MKVIVHDDVLLSVMNTHDSVKLHQLFAHAISGRHVVIFQSSCIDSWLSSLGKIDHDAYETAKKLSLSSAARFPANAATVHITLTNTPIWNDPESRLSLDDALAMLNEPLGILVENSANDWAFLCRIMRVSERKRLKDFEAKSWIEPLHGGGSTLIHQLNLRLANPRKGIRTFVLFDSDRLHPSELKANWVNNKCQAFVWEKKTKADLPYRYWMLKRRFIESYMPHDELYQIRERNKVDAFVNMQQEQRWYYHMKKGFNGDKPPTNARSLNLYSKISVTDKNLLADGFGEDLANHYQLAVTQEFNWDEDARQEAAQALPNLMRLL